MKKRFIRLFCVLLSLGTVLWGCGKKEPSPSDGEGGEPSVQVTEDFEKREEELFDQADYNTDFDEASSVRITLKGSSAESSSDSVRIADGRVVITAEATYLIEGSLENGMIVVDADKSASPHLIFRGVSVTNSSSAALYLKSAKHVILTLTEGTDNRLASTGSYTAIDDANIDGAVFSKGNLILNGTGSLRVESASGHGIVVKDDLTVTGGSYTVDAAGHGLDVNDSLRVDGASLSLKTGKDGIHVENTEDVSLGYLFFADGSVSAESAGDGISASSTVEIKAGSFSLLTGGGSANSQKNHTESGGMMPPGMRQTTTKTDTVSAKGLKAEGGILVDGGTITVDSADDAIHSGKNVTVRGGTLTLKTGDDGMHADEKMQIVGGSIQISESYEGLEAIDLLLAGGEIHMVCRDDGINAAGGNDEGEETDFYDDRAPDGMPPRPGMSGVSSNGSVTISGGTIYIRASGDGIDANGTLTVSGGRITVCGPATGDTATLDFDRSGGISGGTFIGTGGSFMAQTFSESSQGVISLNVGQQAAGTTVTLADGKGNVLLSHAPELPFSVVILSCPDMEIGESYTVTVGIFSEEFEAE